MLVLKTTLRGKFRASDVNRQTLFAFGHMAGQVLSFLTQNPIFLPPKRNRPHLPSIKRPRTPLSSSTMSSLEEKKNDTPPSTPPKEMDLDKAVNETDGESSVPVQVVETKEKKVEEVNKVPVMSEEEQVGLFFGRGGMRL